MVFYVVYTSKPTKVYFASIVPYYGGGHGGTYDVSNKTWSNLSKSNYSNGWYRTYTLADGVVVNLNIPGSGNNWTANISVPAGTYYIFFQAAGGVNTSRMVTNSSATTYSSNQNYQQGFGFVIIKY